MIHLDGKAKIASQQLFDAALDHIRKQGCPSVVNGECVYRCVRNGKMCGCAFAPAIQHYSETMEGQSAAEFYGRKHGYVDAWGKKRCRNFTMKKKFHRSLFDWAQPADSRLAQDIQQAHDKAAFINDAFIPTFERNMRLVAKYYGLSYSNEKA